MTEASGKTEIRTLVEETISMALARELPIERLRGTALFDQSRDELVTSLNSFSGAASAVLKIPNFTERLGVSEVNRIVLQFVFQYFTRIDDLRYETSIFEPLWEDFCTEVQTAHWITRGVANLRYFETNTFPLELGDGITIRGRNAAELETLGFDSRVWNELAEDWTLPFGASSYVLVVEQSTRKEPSNLISIDGFALFAKATRALGTLRLIDTGSVGIGRMWAVRPSRFNMGMSGLGVIGFSLPSMGSQYVWTDDVAQAYPAVYRNLAQLETDGYGKAPGNLDVALRSFMGTYDRWPSFVDAQLLDAITALEALLGTGMELSFRLAFRVAGLLAASDDERATILKLMKEFYDTRSRVVHGGQLTQKHHLRLQSIDELRALVRRLLKAFVAYAAGPQQAYSKTFFQEGLDVALVHAEKREELRNALGLS
jgi:hypothetical protein